MTYPDRNAKAAALRALHVPGEPLVAPNAWDAASARIIEHAGFAAVATSSAAVAAVHGWDDGESTPLPTMLAAAAEIADAVDVPVTVDFERGYRLGADALVEQLAATGAVGVNLQDSEPTSTAMIPVADQVRFLRSIRAAAEAAGTDLVINARVDSFLRTGGEDADLIADAAERATAYFDAGADCVYPIGASSTSAIGELTRRIDGPVNVGRAPDSALAIAALAELGVARITFGPGLQRRLYSIFESDVLRPLGP